MGFQARFHQAMVSLEKAGSSFIRNLDGQSREERELKNARCPAELDVLFNLDRYGFEKRVVCVNPEGYERKECGLCKYRPENPRDKDINPFMPTRRAA